MEPSLAQLKDVLSRSLDCIAGDTEGGHFDNLQPIQFKCLTALVQYVAWVESGYGKLEAEALLEAMKDLSE